MNGYVGMFSALACYSVVTLIGANIINIQIFASNEFDASDFYNEECADRMFDKYVKGAEPEYDKYLDKADDAPFPDSENEINDYLDSLDPLAEEYIDNLEPYAEDYIDDLDACMK